METSRRFFLNSFEIPARFNAHFKLERLQEGRPRNNCCHNLWQKCCDLDWFGPAPSLRSWVWAFYALLRSSGFQPSGRPCWVRQGQTRSHQMRCSWSGLSWCGQMPAMLRRHLWPVPPFSGPGLEKWALDSVEAPVTDWPCCCLWLIWLRHPKWTKQRMFQVSGTWVKILVVFSRGAAVAPCRIKWTLGMPSGMEMRWAFPEDTFLTFYRWVLQEALRVPSSFPIEQSASSKVTSLSVLMAASCYMVTLATYSDP